MCEIKKVMCIYLSLYILYIYDFIYRVISDLQLQLIVLIQKHHYFNSHAITKTIQFISYIAVKQTLAGGRLISWKTRSRGYITTSSKRTQKSDYKSS